MNYLGLLPVPGWGGNSSGGWTESWPINFPSPREGGVIAPEVPGYCPPGTYHPQWDPYVCTPYPDTTAGQGGRVPGSSSGTTIPPATPIRRTQLPVVCPPGQTWNTKERRCMPTAAAPLADRVAEVPWWVWVVVGGAVLVAVSRR